MGSAFDTIASRQAEQTRQLFEKVAQRERERWSDVDLVSDQYLESIQALQAEWEKECHKSMEHLHGDIAKDAGLTSLVDEYSSPRTSLKIQELENLRSPELQEQQEMRRQLQLMSEGQREIKRLNEENNELQREKRQLHEDIIEKEEEKKQRQEEIIELEQEKKRLHEENNEFQKSSAKSLKESKEALGIITEVLWNQRYSSYALVILSFLTFLLMLTNTNIQIGSTRIMPVHVFIVGISIITGYWLYNR